MTQITSSCINQWIGNLSTVTLWTLRQHWDVCSKRFVIKRARSDWDNVSFVFVWTNEPVTLLLNGRIWTIHVKRYSGLRNDPIGQHVNTQSMFGNNQNQQSSRTIGMCVDGLPTKHRHRQFKVVWAMSVFIDVLLPVWIYQTPRWFYNVLYVWYTHYVHVKSILNSSQCKALWP